MHTLKNTELKIVIVFFVCFIVASFHKHTSLQRCVQIDFFSFDKFLCSKTNIETKLATFKLVLKMKIHGILAIKIES